LSYPLAKEISFKKNTYGKFYWKMLRLLREGYIIDRGCDDPDIDVLQLSKKGFEYVYYDLGELREKRFAPQSVTHDYWATMFQIGEFVYDVPDGVKLYSEQQLQCADDSLLPEWVPKSRSHIPDGFTLIENGSERAVFATEIELNLKPMLRYDKAGYYFDAALSKVDVVFWVCAETWISRSIFDRLAGLKLRNIEIHQFLLTSDFQTLGWDAIVERGTLRGKSLREIYRSKTGLKPIEEGSNTGLTGFSKIFFPRGKSPQISKA
jgi:hypothetical protein